MGSSSRTCSGRDAWLDLASLALIWLCLPLVIIQKDIFDIPIYFFQIIRSQLHKWLGQIIRLGLLALLIQAALSVYTLFP